MTEKGKEKNHIFEFEEEGEELSLKTCVKFIEKNKKGLNLEDTPHIGGPNEEKFPITDERIFKIPKCKKYRKLGFVDGGNAPIITSADFNVSLQRVAGAMFRSTKYLPFETIPPYVEFHTATILNQKEKGVLEYITKFFPMNPKDKIYLPKKEIIIPYDDKSIIKGGFRPKIEKFGSIARRFAEWSYARELIDKELNEGDIFVRDGSLQTGYKGETKLAHLLYERAQEKNVIVTGLSKTCRLPTNRGDSLISVINIIGELKYPESQWYYHPIYKITRADNQADLFFVKLNKFAYCPFRFDIYLKQSEKMDQQTKAEIISNLASNAKDLSFPGYPYGLIKVDQMSRVAFREVDSQKIIVLSEFEREHYRKYILPRLRSVDAHDLLNKIRKN